MKKEVQDPCYRRDYKITAYILANIAFFSFTAKVIYDKVQFNRSLEKEIEDIRKARGELDQSAGLREVPSTLMVNGSSTLGNAITDSYQCRSKILDGDGRLIGTYMTTCSESIATLTISTFEKP